MRSRPDLRFLASTLLAILLSPPAPASAAPECEYEHTYLGNLPKEKEPGWHAQAQGIDHDATRWYISQIPRSVFFLPFQIPPDKCTPLGGFFYRCNEPTLWKVPLEYNLSSDVECGDPAIQVPRAPACARLSEMAPEVWADGYNHYGDIDYYEPDGNHAYVCVPLEGALLFGSGLPGTMAFFRAENLSFVARAVAPNLGATAAWCAIDPEGFVYSSGKREDGRTDTVRKYYLDWSELAAEDPMPELIEVGTIPLQERDGTPVILEKYLQGGTFSGDGSFLYLMNGSGSDACADCGIQVFELRDAETSGACDGNGACVARRVARSNGSLPFKFEYHPGGTTREEPEGLTWWDLSAPDAPPIFYETSLGHRLDTSQLHALLLDNDSHWTTLNEDDDVYIKHYRVEELCEPQAGITVRPRAVDFEDVDVGGSEAQGITVANDGDAPLLVQGVALGAGSDPGFAIASAPTTPATILPASSEPVQVTFTPASAGLVTGVLEISSDDPDEPHIEVALAGTGASLEEQLRRLIELFDESVAAGFLAGSGSGSSVAHRRDALRAMLAEALALLEGGYVAEACDQLYAALLHTDGERTPKDLVEGDAASDLADAIRRLREHLGCLTPEAG